MSKNILTVSQAEKDIFKIVASLRETTQQVTTTRDVLTANRTYYVASTGSDSNPGTGSTASSAWLTIEHAVSQMYYLDFSGGWTATIQVANGTYTPAFTMAMGELVGSAGGGVELRGDPTTPSNVVINYSASGSLFYVTGGPWQWKITGFKLTNSVGDIVEADGGFVWVEQVEWGAASKAHENSHNSATIYNLGVQTISGGGTAHWDCQSGSFIRHRSTTVTLTGTPAFSSAFIKCSLGECQVDNLTFTGGATGVRAIFETGGRAQLNTLSPTYFPGDAAVQIHSGSSYGNTSGPASSLPPTTQTGDYSQVISDGSIIFNKGSTATLTLLAAATYSGRKLLVKTIQAQTVVSAASDVVPLAGGAAGTAILAGTAGKWALLQSDGTNWVIMAAN